MKPKTIAFQEPRTCPRCQREILSADLKREFDPVVVINCPHCDALLWRPGLETDGPLFVFDPESGDESI